MARKVVNSIVDNRRNHIMNGNFDFWQRGTSKTGPGGYLADRWAINTNFLGGNVLTSQSTDVPNTKSKYSLRVEHTGSNTTSLTEYTARQNYERQFARQIFDNQTVTLSFWYKSNKTGMHLVRFANDIGTGVSNPTDTAREFEVYQADTWEFKTITVFMGIDSWGTDAENTFSSFVDIGLGSTQGGQTQINVGDYFQISQVMLNEGDTPAPFRLAKETIDDELMLCYRYYEKGYFYNRIDVSTNDTFGKSQSFKANKRALPTLSIIADNSYGMSTIYLDSTGRTDHIVWWGTADSNTVEHKLKGEWAADAEI